jgi:hypothetical protein
MTHSPGKIEYICRYFIMSFRKQIGEYKFGKNCFYTLRSTMSHSPSTNSSSLIKITAAYSTGYYVSPPIDQYLKFKNHCSLDCAPIKSCSTKATLHAQPQRHLLRDRRPSPAACPACWTIGTKEMK